MGDPIRLLICDDNDNVRLTLARALKYKKGVEVCAEVGSFEELLEGIDTYKPDVILSDVNLPGMTGVDGIKALRAAGHETPIIIMSADQRNREPSIAAGALSFFYKGTTNFSELVEDLKRAAGSS